MEEAWLERLRVRYIDGPDLEVRVKSLVELQDVRPYEESHACAQ